MLIDIKQEMANIKSVFGGLNVIRRFYIMDFIINKQISFGTEEEMVSIKFVVAGDLIGAVRIGFDSELGLWIQKF